MPATTSPAAGDGSRRTAIGTRGEDASFIERLKARDEAAVRVLIAEYGDRLYHVALGLTRDHRDAEEVLQDVFWRILQQIDSFRGEARLSTWIYRLVVDAALMKRRGRRAKVEVLLEDRLPRFLDSGERHGDRTYLLADWSRDPEAELLSLERQRMVKLTIDGLPERYRAVLVLRDVEDLSNEEVAEALGESLAAVKSRVHRGRMALRERLTQAFGRRPER